MQRERRLWDGQLELRANGPGKTLVGYAAVFNRLSANLGGFVEQVAPGAFTKTIQEADVRHLLNHDSNVVLGRNRAGTLRLAEDTTGLHYEVDLPATQAARDLAESVERGDITGSSFAFRVVGDDGAEWSLTDDEFPLRTLRQVQLYDTSTVTYPAYPSTQEDDVKAALRSLANSTGRPLEDLVTAAASNELRSLMTPADDPADGPGSPHPSGLAVARSRDLLLRQQDA
ncbi:MAG: HK97 family phage prohead protease [Actinomycetota bacterium]|nr:HK97 family phage prohead protease [Actinomycetota bacterium]